MDEEPTRSSSDCYPSEQHKNDATPQAIIAIKDALIKEGDANRQQEGREDWSNKIIAAATLFLVFCTTGGIIYQDIVLSNTDHTIKQSMVGDQRAYVLFSDAKFTDETIGKQRIGYTIKNAGKTPVYNLQQWLFLDVLKPPVINYAPVKPWTAAATVAYFHPSLTVGDLESRGFTIKEIETIKHASIYTGAPRLYFIGRSTYEDVFKQKRCTNFCFMWVKENGGRFTYCDDLNKADQNDDANSCDNAFDPTMMRFEHPSSTGYR